MRLVKGFTAGVTAVLATMVLVQPAPAAQFTWEQNAGFLFTTADDLSTLRAGQFFGVDAAPNIDHGGLDFSGVQGPVPPAPDKVYRSIQWGCLADGNNDPGVTNCANGGALANSTTAAELALVPGRSSLVLDVFTNVNSGILDSATGDIVVIAQLNHLNRVVDNEANALKSVTISSNLVISGANPAVESPNSIPITFLETNNIPAGENSTAADCPGLNPLGSVCDDEFTFDTSGFANVPFLHNGVPFFLQFGLQPIPSCSQLVDTIGTIQIFQCTDNVNHRIAIDFQNGKAWAMEGFDNAIQVTMFVTEQPVGGDGCTPGYWKQKQHFGSYTPPYFANQKLSAAFPGLDFPGIDETQVSLVQALGTGGGGTNALLRHFVAAVLNAANPNVVSQYENIQQIIDAVAAVLAGGQATLGGVAYNSVESLKNALEAANEGGCPLGRAPGSGNAP